MTVWASGGAYDAFIGRWSRAVAAAFVPWLGVAPGARWVDVGCGTGALTEAILRLAAPASVVGVEPSEPFREHAAAHVEGAEFRAGDAISTGLPDGGADALVSGLVLNFVPDPEAAVAEFRRVVRPGGTIGAYVWDYGEGMEVLRHFWEAARTVDPDAPDEALRSPVATRDGLADLFDGEVRPIDVPARFADFEEYWAPFLGGTGPAPVYLASLDAGRRDALREALRARVGDRPEMTVRAWAVRARA